MSTENLTAVRYFTVNLLFYFDLPCFHRYNLDETLHHGYIKVVIISQRSFSRFRDVKNIFSYFISHKKGSLRIRFFIHSLYLLTEIKLYMRPC